MRKALAYFGLDGSSTRQDWGRASVEVLPPIVVSTLVAWLDGIGGLAGWAVWALCSVLAWVLWWPLIVRLAPWRRL
jgi:hypothetical protein